MPIVNQETITGRRFPAGRESVNLVGGRSPIQAAGFNMGRVSLDPNGGQVPWHNHEQEEIYYILTGNGEMCVASEMQQVAAGDVIYIPGGAFHQLTNVGAEPLLFIYVYSPNGDVAHWKQELEGSLPIAGVDAPGLPDGACPQRLS